MQQSLAELESSTDTVRLRSMTGALSTECRFVQHTGFSAECVPLAHIH